MPLIVILAHMFWESEGKNHIDFSMSSTGADQTLNFIAVSTGQDKQFIVI